MSNHLVPIAVGTGLAVVAGAVSVPVSVGASLAVVAGALAGGIADGSDVAVGRACDACGIARAGEWGPRTGAVLAAPRLTGKKKFGSSSGEWEKWFAKGRAAGIAACKRGEGEVPAERFFESDTHKKAFEAGYAKGLKECGVYPSTPATITVRNDQSGVYPSTPATITVRNDQSLDPRAMFRY